MPRQDRKRKRKVEAVLCALLGEVHLLKEKEVLDAYRLRLEGAVAGEADGVRKLWRERFRGILEVLSWEHQRFNGVANAVWKKTRTEDGWREFLFKHKKVLYPDQRSFTVVVPRLRQGDPDLLGIGNKVYAEVNDGVRERSRSRDRRQEDE